MTAMSSSLFLVILLSALNCYADAADPPLSCIPGSAFMYDHNICYCNYDGTKMTCKRKMFTTLTPQLQLLQLQNIKTNCSPGALFTRPCQKCLCDISGKAASCVNLQQCPKNERIEKRDNCTPGSVFYDNCNGCICGSDGTAACTNLRCGFQRVNDPMDDTTRCVPNSYFTMGCNDCNCNDMGTRMTCYGMSCPPMTFYHENILNVTLNCNPSKMFDYNCHQCICDKTGAFALCSGKECPHEYNMVEVKDTPGNCNPGMIFADDCNVCICGENRRGVCTTLTCDVSYKYKYVDYLHFGIP